MNKKSKEKMILEISKSFVCKIKKGKTFVYAYVFDKLNKNKNCIKKISILIIIKWKTD